MLVWESLEARRCPSLSPNMDKQPRQPNIHSFVVNVSNTHTAFTVWYLPLPLYCHGLTPPPRLTSPTRSDVHCDQSAPRDEEEAVQEGRGKHHVHLRIVPHHPQHVSSSPPAVALTLHRTSLPPHHLPSLPRYRADSR